MYKKGASADAGPHYQKLYGRVTTLVAIAEVSPSEVQCKGLTLEETPRWSGFTSPSGKYELESAEKSPTFSLL